MQYWRNLLTFQRNLLTPDHQKPLPMVCGIAVWKTVLFIDCCEKPQNRHGYFSFLSAKNRLECCVIQMVNIYSHLLGGIKISLYLAI
jgi:hypothetical protein